MDDADRVGREYLIGALKRRIGLPRSQAATLLESIVAHMCDALSRGENVQVTNFGTFALHEKRARLGRNPKTGVEAVITARRVLIFRPSKKLNARVVQIKTKSD